MPVLAVVLTAENVILYSAAIVAAAAAFRWARRTLRTIDSLLVLLGEMNKQLGGKPNAFQILEQIIAQFRTDSGSSLKDQINTIEDAVAGLTQAARTNEQAASILEGGVETVRQLAKMDRLHAANAAAEAAEERDRMMRLMQRLEGIVATGVATGLRMEAGDAVVATDLAARDARADAVMDGEPGEAADAASQTP